MALRHFLCRNKSLLSSPSSGVAYFSSSSSKYLVKVGIPEFLKAIGKEVEAHASKTIGKEAAKAIGKQVEAHASLLESEIGDFQNLLVTRGMKLRRLEPKIPCKHRKLILKYAHKYRLGLWRPRAEPVKSN